MLKRAVCFLMLAPRLDLWIYPGVGSDWDGSAAIETALMIRPITTFRLCSQSRSLYVAGPESGDLNIIEIAIWPRAISNPIRSVVL